MTRKLRKRPDGLSYKEVFSLNDANDEGASKAARSDDTPRSEAPDNKPVPLQAVRSDQHAIEPDRADELSAVEADKTDLGRKPVAVDKTPQVPNADRGSQTEGSKPDETSDLVAGPMDQAPTGLPKRADETPPSRKPKSAPAPSPEKSRLRGYLPFPALGVSSSFDAIHDAYGLKFATKHFLDKAIEGFVEAVRAGKGPTKNLRPDYPSMPDKVQATRHVPLDVVDHVREMIDPMGLLPHGTLGTRVLEMAMAWHMRNDGKKN
ncbi:hypothetical protein LX81_02968 [Palleronia aestuarii]|uniref:Uncharacterized protein n=1 Tax=Palleronia aestuarii TaxID=568105 RepID=A0A2W7PXA6_9RHOB|nr:hypothetical protein [Palleronia aestuarii]PZX14169.1 hypothetical protein LX81_02968 [Palleronia aestuarii]